MWIDPKDSFVVTINAGEIVPSADFSAGVTLRFPRIVKIRAKEFDDGPKPAEEAECSTGLLEMYEKRYHQQQYQEREMQYGPDSSGGEENVKNKFKSMEQNLKNGKLRKKRPREELNVRLPNIEGCRSKTSDILSSYTFMVLDGNYKLGNLVSLDEVQAKAEGWYDSASLVTCQQDVVDFVLQHGGQIGIEDYDFVIGGSADDPRVTNYRRAIERATDATMGSNTKEDQNLRKMAQSGVVKWTFLYSAVAGLSKKRVVEDIESLQHKKSLVPRKHNYLVVSKFVEACSEKVEDAFGLHLFEDASIVELKRALREARKRRSNGTDNAVQKRLKNDCTPPWQFEFDTCFTREEKVSL